MPRSLNAINGIVRSLNRQAIKLDMVNAIARKS
jgi:hypothetical protein